MFDGIPALLQAAAAGLAAGGGDQQAQRGWRARCSTPRGLLPHFAAVYGADKSALRKPAPAMLNRAAQALGLSTPQLLMVGDSAADMGSAAAAGSPAVWAGWGYGALHSLPTPPRWQVQRPGQLLDILVAGRR